jgi:hypothetical protein
MMEQIKTFEDACKVVGISPELPDVSGFPEKHRKSVLAQHQLTTIAEALNEGWTPDWSDHRQYKYIPWFEDVSGVGLSYVDYVAWHSLTNVGSRLYYKSNELAEYAGKQFESIYRDYLTL